MNSKSACRSIATARPSRRGLKARKKLRGRTSLTSHGNRLPRGLRGQHSLRGRKGFDPHHAMQFIQGQDWLGLNNYIEDALLQAGFGRVNAARMSTSWVGDWSGAQWPASSFIGQLQQVSDIIGRGPESYRPGMGLYKRLGRRGRKAAPEGDQDAEWETNGRWFRRQGGQTVRISGPGGQEVAGDEASQGEQARLERMPAHQRYREGRTIHPDYAMEVGPLPPRKRGVWERVRRATVGPSREHIMDEIAHDLSQMTGHLSYGVPFDELEVRPGILSGGRVYRHRGGVHRSDSSSWDDDYITIRVNPKHASDVERYLNSKFSRVIHPSGSRPGEFEVRVDNYTGKSLRGRKGLVRRKAHARSIVTTRPKKCCKSLGGLPTLARNLNRIASKGWAITDNAGLQVYTKSGWQPRALVQHKSLDNAYLFRTQRDAEAFCALHTLNGFADRI